MYTQNIVLTDLDKDKLQLKINKYKKDGYTFSNLYSKNTKGEFVAVVYKKFEGELKHGTTRKSKSTIKAKK